MKILITGGAGFIGSYLSNFLVKTGHIVTVVDNFIRGQSDRLDSRVKLIEINLLNPNEFKKIGKDYDWVIHLAAINGTDNFYKNNELVFEVGFKSIINIYEHFKYSNTSLIIASSAEVYQTPSIIPTPESEILKIPDITNPRYSYGGSKIFSELIAYNYGLDYFKKVIIFRPHNIYGPNMGFKHVVPQLIMKALDAKKHYRKSIELIGDGKETRAFCYIDDLISGLDILIKKGVNKNIYHIGNSQEISIFSLTENIINNIDPEIKIKKGVNTHIGGTSRRCPDISKIKSIGYVPKTDISEGIQKTIEWYKKNTSNQENLLL